MPRWMIKVTEDDVERAKALLLDSLRSGKINHSEYIVRLGAIEKAKYVGDLYDQVFASSSALRRRGGRRFLSVRKLNLLSLIVAMSVFLGVGARSSITWVVVALVAFVTLFANAMKLWRTNQITKRSAKRSVDL